MSKLAAYGSATIILLVAWAAGPAPGILATLAIIVIAAVTVRIHPRVRHTGWRGCAGTGEHRGFFFPWRFRKCPRCNSGRLISWVAGHFGAGHIQSEYAQSRAARAVARDEHRWR